MSVARATAARVAASAWAAVECSEGMVGNAIVGSGGDLLSGAMSRVSGASARAQQTGAGAQAANVDSPGWTTFASAP